MTCFGKKSQERRCRSRPTTSMNTIDCAKNTSHLTIPDAEITITSNSTDISLCPTAPIFDVNPGAGKFITPVGRRCAWWAGCVPDWKRENGPIKGTRVTSTIDWSDIGNSAHHQHSGRQYNRLQITLLSEQVVGAWERRMEFGTGHPTCRGRRKPGVRLTCVPARHYGNAKFPHAKGETAIVNRRLVDNFAPRGWPIDIEERTEGDKSAVPEAYKSAAPEAYGGSWKSTRYISDGQKIRGDHIGDQITSDDQREIQRFWVSGLESDCVQGRRPSRPWHGGRSPPCKDGLYSNSNTSQVRSLSVNTCQLTDNPVDPNHCLTLSWEPVHYLIRFFCYLRKLDRSAWDLF